MVMYIFQCYFLSSSILSFPCCVQKSVLYVCVSIAALQISSSVPFYLVPPVQCGPSSGPPVTLFGSDQCNRLWITIRRVPVETSGIIGTTHVTCLGFSYLIVEFYKDRASLCDACHRLVSLVCLLPCPHAPGLLPGGLWVCS